jgi:uncharacterized membrane protein
VRYRVVATLRTLLDWLAAHPERVFVVCALLFGVIICFRLPPLSGTDEFTHFPRAFQIQSGQLWEQKLPQNQYGGYLPSNIVNLIGDYRDLSRKDNNQTYKNRSEQLRAIYLAQHDVDTRLQEASFSSDAVYPPWTYLPSVLGIFIARQVRAPLIWYVYLARLASLLVWVVLVWLAVKVIPRGKWFIVTLALLPTSITQALTVGLGALILGVSWLLIALVFAVIAKKVKLNWQMLACLTILSFVLSTLKQGYFLIAALPILIPNNLSANRRRFIIWKVVLGALLISSVVAFGLFTSQITKDIVLTPRLGIYINSSAQVHYILQHPFIFAGRLLIQPFTKSFDTVYLGLVGILTNRLIYLSVPLIGLLYLALLLSWRNTKAMPQFVAQQKYLLVSTGVVAIGTYMIIATALYVAFTQVGSPVVEGLVGRYFLPILPLSLVIPMSINGNGGTRLARTTLLLLLLIITLGLVTTTFSLI